jgi:hypothetical protein
MPAGPVAVAPQQIVQTAAIAQLPGDALAGATTPLVIGVYAGDRRVSTVKTGFIGPAAGAAPAR